ncbi:deiodinase family protein [Singulisphaera sp. PoT]|uniref:deiodinase family protein n=1 Tax=Singulisphaera sp. PoT TaxID=3411797 RepID=UPI003BF611AF
MPHRPRGMCQGLCALRVGLILSALFSVTFGTSASYGQQGPQSGPKREPRPLDRLEAVWPDQPEWVAMLVDILSGSQLGPGDGWFRKAVAQTRYNWKSVAAELDRDGDNSISRQEFGGSDKDFARLDRDRDASLTPADFDFSAHALTPSLGMMTFYKTDRDGNGKVTRAEFDGLFRAMGGDETGYLSLSDFQQAFVFPPRRPSGGSAGGPSVSSGPTPSTLVKGLFRQEIGSLQPGPALNESAPDFTLKTVDGSSEKTLSKEVGPKPVVLVFGNFTCGPFRSQAGNVEKVFKRYKDRATFLMVYVREAHPTDGWHMESNDRVGVALRQPTSYDERVSVAQTCSKALGLGMPMLVDTIDDEVGARYSGMPSRLYVIDGQGKVAYKSGRGPFGFKPDEMEQALIFAIRKDEANAEAKAGEAKKPDIPAAENGGVADSPPKEQGSRPR